MAHKVVALGFGSCDKLAAHVSTELSEYFDEEVEGFSYRGARADSKKFQTAVDGAEVITDSAGFLNMRGLKPKEVLAVSAPVPVFLPLLIAKACMSGYELMKPVDGETREYKDLKRTCGENLVAEVSRHPVANMGRLGVIAAYDSIAMAIAAKEEEDIETAFLYRRQDRLFQPTEAQRNAAYSAGIAITTIDGRHEDFACEPAKTMGAYEREQKLVLA